MIRKLIAIPGRLLDMDDLGALVVTGFAVLLVVLIIWLHPWTWNWTTPPSVPGSVCQWSYQYGYDDSKYHTVVLCSTFTPAPTPTVDRR